MSLNDKPYFSIIVPVYNTEESYLKSSIESVLNQSFKDYELIIIDDGSTIQYEITNHTNIKYIQNKTNRGTLYCRRLGGILSLGKYIIYLDADDRLSENALERIFKSIDKEYDIIHFGVLAISSNSNKKKRLKEEKKVSWYLSSSRSIIDSDYLFNECLSEKLPHNMCGKAFRSEIIKEASQYLPDSHLIHSEDMLQCLVIGYLSRSYRSIHERLYICNIDAGYSNRDISELSVSRYEKSCLDSKVTLGAFYNFLCIQGVEVLHYYDYLRLYSKQYQYLASKTNNEGRYLEILDKYFDIELLERYKEFERLHQYYLRPLSLQEEINKKLLPYFFSIILHGYYIHIRILGITITIKTNICYDKPIVVSLSNLLRNIFSLSSDSKGLVLTICGLKFIKRRGGYVG